MKRTEIKTTYEKAISRWGLNNQCVKACEEMGELTQVLAKYATTSDAELREHILEEIQDVEILIKQLKLGFEFTEDELLMMRARKVCKLELRLMEG